MYQAYRSIWVQLGYVPAKPLQKNTFSKVLFSYKQFAYVTILRQSVQHNSTLLCFFKFVSRANSSKSCPLNNWPRKCEMWPLIIFWNKPPSNPRFLSRRGPRSLELGLSQHYIGPKMTFLHFPNFCRKKFPGLKKEFFCTYWMNVEVLPHDFCKLQPPKLDKNVPDPFWQAGKLFSAEIWKMKECHFWSHVMLR